MSGKPHAYRQRTARYFTFILHCCYLLTSHSLKSAIARNLTHIPQVRSQNAVFLKHGYFSITNQSIVPCSLARSAIQNIDHLGIVAGIIDEMGLVEEINQLLGTHPQEIISTAQVVKAMIINGLGFINAPLYLFEKFFEGIATEHLLGEGIQPEHLDYDRLGRVFDKLYDALLTEIFIRVALLAAGKFGVKMDSFHLDSSSFHVHGDYETIPDDETKAESGLITITYGYSRDHRCFSIVL